MRKLKVSKKREAVSSKSQRAEERSEYIKKCEEAKHKWKSLRQRLFEDVESGYFQGRKLDEYIGRRNEVELAERHYRVLTQKCKDVVDSPRSVNIVFYED